MVLLQKAQVSACGFFLPFLKSDNEEKKNYFSFVLSLFKISFLSMHGNMVPRKYTTEQLIKDK